jgi:hypothetical protein
MRKFWAMLLAALPLAAPAIGQDAGSARTTARCVANPKDLHTTWAAIFDTDRSSDELGRLWDAYAKAQYQAFASNCIITTAQDAHAIEVDAATNGWPLEVVKWYPGMQATPQVESVPAAAAAMATPLVSTAPQPSPDKVTQLPARQAEVAIPPPVAPLAVPAPAVAAEAKVATPARARPASARPQEAPAPAPKPTALPEPVQAQAVPVSTPTPNVYVDQSRSIAEAQRAQKAQEEAYRQQLQEHDRQVADAQAAQQAYQERLSQYDRDRAAYDAQIRAMQGKH